MKIEPSLIWGPRRMGDVVWGYVSTSGFSRLPIELCLCRNDNRDIKEITQEILPVFVGEANEIFATTIVEHEQYVENVHYVEHYSLLDEVEKYIGSLTGAYLIIGRDIKGNETLERLKYEGGLGIDFSSNKRDEFVKTLLEDPKCLKPSDIVRIFVNMYSPLPKRDGDSEDKLLERMARRLRGYELKPVRFSLSIDCVGAFDSSRKEEPKIDLNEVWSYWKRGEGLFIGEMIGYKNPCRRIIRWERYI